MNAPRSGALNLAGRFNARNLITTTPRRVATIESAGIQASLRDAVIPHLIDHSVELYTGVETPALYTGVETPALYTGVETPA